MIGNTMIRSFFDFEGKEVFAKPPMISFLPE